MDTSRSLHMSRIRQVASLAPMMQVDVGVARAWTRRERCSCYFDWGLINRAGDENIFEPFETLKATTCDSRTNYVLVCWDSNLQAWRDAGRLLSLGKVIHYLQLHDPGPGRSQVYRGTCMIGLTTAGKRFALPSLA